MPNEPRIVDIEDAESYVTPQAENMAVLARGDEPGEDHDVLEFTVPTEPGAVPLHVHRDNDEGFYVLEGTLLFQVGDSQYRLTAGSYAYGPRGVPHAYRNIGDGPARMLVIYTPGNFVTMTEEIEALGPLDVEDESALERVVPILESYGIKMVGPPLEE